MAVELRPLGVACNLGCDYCYQNPQRDAGNKSNTYRVEDMLTTAETVDGPVALFGGEPLLVPLADLERFFAWAAEHRRPISLQTNGVLLNDRHLDLFEKYAVEVGVSLDGPDELNDLRWQGTLERTRRATAKAHGALAALCARGLSPAVIITLHRQNAVRSALPRLLTWILQLEASGVRFGRLHLLESESPDIRARYGLTVRENVDALLAVAALQAGALKRLRFDLFRDMWRMLSGNDSGAGCVWMACDPYTTAAVQGVEGDGAQSNCGRTNKDGIDFGKADTPGYERYLALYQVPQQDGGCQGCRFFLMCKGQCPGTGIDGDWRNKTEHCQVWMDLYARLEAEMLAAGEAPLSVDPLRAELERTVLDSWAAGRNLTLAQAVRTVRHAQHAGG